MRKRAASVLPEPTSEVGFEISAEAAAAGRRAGHLWIWPGSHRSSASAATEPPGDPQGETRTWTAYRQAGFVVHVDDAIVPPERWVLAPRKKKGRHLEARWYGAYPRRASGRPQLIDRRSLYRRVSDKFLLPGLVLWLLALAGLVRWRFAETWVDVLTPTVAVLIVAVVWVWRRVRRVDASAP